MHEHSNPDAKSLTHFLKALLAGGAVLFGAGAAQASLSSKPVAPKPEAEPSSKESMENRLDKVRKQIAASETETPQTPENPNSHAPLDDAKTLYWRNWGNWRNGGWPNWRNGWHNWGNGGWGNRRGGIWANW